MPKLKRTSSQQTEYAITLAFKTAMLRKEWSASHLAKICHLKREQVSRTINHPCERNFKFIAIIAEKLGMDSIPLK